MSPGDLVRVKALPLIANRDSNHNRLPSQPVKVWWVEKDGRLTVTDPDLERWWYGIWPHWLEPGGTGKGAR